MEAIQSTVDLHSGLSRGNLQKLSQLVISFSTLMTLEVLSPVLSGLMILVSTARCLILSPMNYTM